MSRPAYSLLLLFVLMLPLRGVAQEGTSYVLQPEESKLWIDGTSNKSDWTVHATEMTAQVNMNGTAEAPGFAETRVVVAAQKLVSRKSTIMDRLMYKTLNAPQHPEIVYVLDSAAVATSTDTGFMLETRGRLTLAGETKPITMPVAGARLADGKVRFTGSYTLLMTDYGLTRPTAMFGALRTGDEVTIHFDLVVAPE